MASWCTATPNNSGSLFQSNVIFEGLEERRQFLYLPLSCYTKPSAERSIAVDVNRSSLPLTVTKKQGHFWGGARVDNALVHFSRLQMSMRTDVDQISSSFSLYV